MQARIQLKNISQHELEQCMKCSICTVYCPVSAVEPKYPGPKHAGPDLMRYCMKDADFFNENLKMCLNCKRCEVACPNGVKIGDIIQEARIKYSTHSPSLRDRMLANTDFVGTMATMVAPVVNFSLGLKPAKMVLHSVMGVDKHRTFPAYSSQKFETWFKKEAADKQKAFSKFVSYFHGCYVNYNYPQLGKDLVKILTACGYGVHLLEKEKCCGVALIANGLSKQAKRQGEANMNAMRQSIKNNDDTLESNPSGIIKNKRKSTLGTICGCSRKSRTTITVSFHTRRKLNRRWRCPVSPRGSSNPFHNHSKIKMPVTA